MSEYPLVSKTGKRYREIGDGIREYESGVIYDMKNKKAISPPEDTRITTENTAYYHQLNRQKTVNKAREWVKKEIAAVSPETIEDFDDAWGMLTGKVAGDVLNDDNRLMDRTNAYKAVGLATQALPDKVQSSVQVGEVNTYILDPDVQKVILDRIGFDRCNYQKHNISQAEDNVVDAEYKSSDNENE